jgi:hypothetical protein
MMIAGPSELISLHFYVIHTSAKYIDTCYFFVALSKIGHMYVLVIMVLLWYPQITVSRLFSLLRYPQMKYMNILFLVL